MNLLKYKGYIGDIQASIEDDVLYGKLQYISALVTYEGKTVDELNRAFQQAVDDYLQTCKDQGCQPEIPCKGSFNVRIGHDLHIAAMLKAKQMNISLNDLVKQSIQSRLSEV